MIIAVINMKKKFLCLNDRGIMFLKTAARSALLTLCAALMVILGYFTAFYFFNNIY